VKEQKSDVPFDEIMQRALVQQRTKQLDFGSNYPIKTQSGENPLVSMLRSPNQKIEFTVGETGEMGKGYGIYRDNPPCNAVDQPTTESHDAELALSADSPKDRSDIAPGDFFIFFQKKDIEAWDIHAVPPRSQDCISLGIIQHDGYIEFPDPVIASEFLEPSISIQVRLSKARTNHGAGNRKTPGAIPRRSGVSSDGKEGPPGIIGLISQWKATNNSNSNSNCLAAQDSPVNHEHSGLHLCIKPHRLDTWDDDPETNIVRYDNYLKMLATTFNSIWNYPNKSWDKDDLLQESRFRIWKGKCAEWIGVSPFQICRKIVKEVCIELRRHDQARSRGGHLTRKSLTIDRGLFESDNVPPDLVSDISTSYQPSASKDLQVVVERVQEAVGSLTKKDQQLIQLKYWDKQTNKEISEIMDISVEAVKSRFQRIKEKLKTSLDIISHKP
jgi:RNA polymerase sigma factor (sigma-70 family)